jgi:hypothetical protein
MPNYSAGFAWLEEMLERAPLGNILAGQRERAPRELFDNQNRQLLRTGKHL